MNSIIDNIKETHALTFEQETTMRLAAIEHKLEQAEQSYERIEDALCRIIERLTPVRKEIEIRPRIIQHDLDGLTELPKEKE